MSSVTKRILVVEDDEWFYDEIAAQLDGAGYEVTHARTDFEAIAYFDDETIPDAIVLDVMLPNANGIALLHELQVYDDTKQLPVILLSTMASSLRFDDMKPYGVTALIDKTTMQPNTLARAVEQALL